MHWQRSGDELLIVGWDVGFPGTARKGGKPDDWTDRDGGVSTCWVCKQQTRIFLMACERERETSVDSVGSIRRWNALLVARHLGTVPRRDLEACLSPWGRRCLVHTFRRCAQTGTFPCGRRGCGTCATEQRDVPPSGSGSNFQGRFHPSLAWPIGQPLGQ